MILMRASSETWIPSLSHLAVGSGRPLHLHFAIFDARIFERLFEFERICQAITFNQKS